MSRRNNKRIANKSNYNDMLPKAVRANQAANRTQAVVQMYMQLLQQLSLSRFTWRGLPSGIDQRFLEYTLFGNSMAIFFYDDTLMRYMVTQANYTQRLNLWYNPTRVIPFGVGYSHRELKSKEFVPIWDNLLRQPMFDVLNAYATRLANIDKALDVNIANAVLPTIVYVSESQKLTVQNLFRQREEGLPVILGYDDSLGDTVNNMASFPTSTPYLVDKLLQAKAQIWNEAISFLGIQNSNNEKAERLISDEVNAGNEKTNVFRDNFLRARQTACDQINNMFDGLNVGVDWADNSSSGIISANDSDGEDNE